MPSPNRSLPPRARHDRPTDTPPAGADPGAPHTGSPGAASPDAGTAGSGSREAGAPADGARPALVTPTFVLAWLVNFSQFLVFYVLVTTMALYAVRQFAASDAASGFAASAFVVGATAARLVSGHLVDTWGHRRTMLVSLVLVVASCAAYLPVASLTALIVVRMVHGIGYAVTSTATMAIAQSRIPAARRAEGTGYFALGTTLATAIGPALGLFLSGRFSYDLVFVTSLAVSVLSLVLALFLRVPRPEPTTAGPVQEQRPPRRARLSLRTIAHPAVVPIGCFMLLVGLCYAGIITYLNAYSSGRGVTAGAGLFFLAYAVAMLVMRFVLGPLQDRRGDNVVVYPALASFALALALLAVATTDWHVVAAGVLTGLGYGTLMPAAQAIAVRAVPSHQLGTGISTLLLLMDVGVGLGPVALGALVSASGYSTMYLVLAAVVVLAGVLYHAVHGRRQARRADR